MNPPAAARSRSRAEAPATFPIAEVRAQFPALQPEHAGSFIFLDNAAGAQIPQGVLDAINHHLIDHNVQRGGRYAKSRAVDQSVAAARDSVAAFIDKMTVAAGRASSGRAS